MNLRRLTTLLTYVGAQQIRDLPPIERQALSDQLARLGRHIEAADRRPTPRAGVLASLKSGERAE